MVVFTCKDCFEHMMSCIYDAWASRLGHANLKLKTEPIGNLELFCEYRHIDYDEEKTRSVIRSIKEKISYQAYMMVYRNALSSDTDKLDDIYRFLIAGFHYGAKVLDFLQEDVVIHIFNRSRKVGNEAHFFREFIRFANMEGNVLVSHIEPKSDILTLVAPHFADRLPSENWMIIDDNRKTAVVHPINSDYYLTSLSEEELEQLSRKTDDPFIDLWIGFFENIAIKERKNKKLQQNMMPIWYRKHVTEFES